MIYISLSQKYEAGNKLSEWLDNCQLKWESLDAHFTLGEIYIKNEEYTKAAYWFKQAAIKGHPWDGCMKMGWA